MSLQLGTRFRGGDSSGSTSGEGGGHSAPTSKSSPTNDNDADASSPTPTPAAADLNTAATITSTNDGEIDEKTTAKKPFSWRDARRTLFPIYGKEEVHKFLLIGSIKFFIIMALTLTRDTKDTLVVTQCGAEAIAFLKVRNVFFLFSNYIMFGSSRIIFVLTLFDSSPTTILTLCFPNKKSLQFTDLRSSSGCHDIYRFVFQNVGLVEQENVVLHNMRSLLPFFRFLRCGYLSQLRSFASFSCLGRISPRN